MAKYKIVKVGGMYDWLCYINPDSIEECIDDYIKYYYEDDTPEKQAKERASLKTETFYCNGRFWAYEITR